MPAPVPKAGQTERLAVREAATKELKVAVEGVRTEAKADLEQVSKAARLAHMELLAERKAACKAARHDAAGSKEEARAACRAARAAAKAAHEQLKAEADADAARKEIPAKAKAALEEPHATFKETVAGK